MADDKLSDNFTSARLAIFNGDREMVNKLKIFHRKNLFPSICNLKERRFNFRRIASVLGFVCTCSSQTFVAVKVNMFIAGTTTEGCIICLC